MKTKELDKKFDAGEDITEFLDLSEATRPGPRTEKSQCRFSHLDDPSSRQRSQKARCR
jgi:hypothetical protein